MDFQALNLNQLGVNNGSPISRPLDDPATVFDITTDRNIIGRSKIRNFNFSQGNGGTINLGGTANGNGVLNLSDSTGLQAILMDNTGITINSGKLTIKNANNTTVIDSTGLVSTASFPSGDIFNGSAGLSTASTSYVDVAGSSGISITTSRAIHVLFTFMVYGNNSQAIAASPQNIEVQLYDDFIAGSIANLIFFGATSTYTPDGISFTLTVTSEMAQRSTILSVAAGTHNYKLQYKTSGSGTAFIDAFEIALVSLGS